MRRPSVLFINRVYPPVRGATGRVLRDLARSFARLGWQVTVITTGEKALSERDGAVRVIRVKGAAKPVGMFGYGCVLVKLLWTAMFLPKTHLVVTMTDPPFVVLIGHLLKRVKGVRHIHWCQDLFPDVFPAIGVKMPRFVIGVFKALTRKAMLSCDKVVVIGRCMAKLLSYDGFDPKQLILIPNWSDAELVKSSQIDGGDDGFRAEDFEGYRPYDHQRKHGPKFRILYAGNIGLAHPVTTILDAAEILNQTHEDIEFVFVGDGPRHDFINKQRAQRHLQNIKLLPYQPSSRLRDLMESGDVHLISMHEKAEGMIVPIKLYAALAVHRPCVLVGSGGSETAQVIGDFNLGEVVAQGDSVKLAEVIRQYRENSDKWFQSYEGAKVASEVFVPRESIKAWLERAKAVVEQDIRKQ